MRKALLCIFLLAACPAFAQSRLDNALRVIQKNNYNLKSLKKWEEWRGAEVNTNRFLANPIMEYDYLYSSPAGTGNQVDFTISQPFDFPTVYGRKKVMARQQQDGLAMEYKLSAQELLLEVKLHLLENVYLNKKQVALEQRVQKAVDLVNQYEKKMQQGEATILDLNKASVHLFQVRKDSAMNRARMKVSMLQLSELNGGQELTFTDTLYPSNFSVPPFHVLDSTIEAEDISPQFYQNEIRILSQQVDVQKALNLPRFEVGYHSQTILNQSYKGFHLGIAIPIAENRNKLQAARANLQYETFKHDQHRVEHRLKNLKLYEVLLSQQKTMEAYQRLITGLDSERLLQKSLQLGETNVSEYTRQKDELFILYNEYLEVELAFHKTLATLYRFRIQL